MIVKRDAENAQGKNGGVASKYDLEIM